MIPSIRFALPLCLTITLSASSLLAGPKEIELIPAPTPPPEGITPLGHRLQMEVGYVGSGDVSGSDLNNGEVASIDSLVRYSYGHRIGRALTLGAGFEWQRFSFGYEDSVGLLPNTLQSVSAIFSAEMFFSKQWLAFAAVRPGIFSDWADISSDDFSMSGLAITAYRQTDTLTWFGGFTFDLHRDFPVIPVLGLRWKFAPDWQLELAAPRSSIRYEFMENWEVFGVAGYKGDAYRVGESFGSDSVWPILNNAWLTYREVRTGAGIKYSWNDSVEFRLEGGAVVWREFNYDSIGVRLTADPAPFVSAGLNVRF